MRFAGLCERGRALRASPASARAWIPAFAGHDTSAGFGASLDPGFRRDDDKSGPG